MQHDWTANKLVAVVLMIWEQSIKDLYLRRLRSHAVFEQAIQQGVASEDFFGTALGEAEGHYEGFQLGVPHVQVDDSLLLLEPGVAKAYRASLAPSPVVQEAATTQVELGGLQTAAQTASRPGSTPVVYVATTAAAPTGGSSPKMKSFHGAVEVNAATARARLLQIAEEVISQLVSDPMAKETVNVEISAEFPQGAAEQVRRAVSENATNLKFKVSEWEK